MNVRAKLTRIGELREGTSKSGRIYKARDIEFKTGIDVFKGGLSGYIAQQADYLVLG